MYEPTPGFVDRLTLCFNIPQEERDDLCSVLLSGLLNPYRLAASRRRLDDLYVYSFELHLNNSSRLCYLNFVSLWSNAGYLRVDWNPASIGPARTAQLFEFLQLHLRSFESKLLDASVSRLDATIDVHGQSFQDLIAIGRTRQLMAYAWDREGRDPNTGVRRTGIRVGQNGGDVQLKLYDKAYEQGTRKLCDRRRPLQGSGLCRPRRINRQWTRCEIELRHLGRVFDVLTHDGENPLDVFHIVHWSRAKAVLLRSSRDTDFIKNVERIGAQWASKFLFVRDPISGRKYFSRKRLARVRRLLLPHRVEWFRPAQMWAEVLADFRRIFTQ